MQFALLEGSDLCPWMIDAKSTGFCFEGTSDNCSYEIISKTLKVLLPTNRSIYEGVKLTKITLLTSLSKHENLASKSSEEHQRVQIEICLIGASP
ncbi:hypothetical protein TNCT_230421 [Trichonephila clavata]|uniref:Uncharacterized protein n=1 Tax=Trichonephila clavata TaxID=2740835 RepID=A0A8X6LXW3_TRICU|nr:hypothetical protein TNCT_230421 [Trichonephila clavata]